MKQIVTHFFHPEIDFFFFFVLDFNVDHSKPMRLSFRHNLPTLLLGSKDLGTNVFRTLICIVGKP